MSKKFIVNDENVLNSYGFRVLTSGISLERFNKNPIGLFNHNRWGSEYKGPVCKWADLKITGGNMTGVPEFDQNDEFAKTIGDKVENGYLNAASIGIQIIETSSEGKNLLPGQTYPTVTKCILREISVVDIPANENAVCLYDDDGKLIDLTDGKVELSSIMKPITPQKENSDMNKFPLTVLVLLSLTENATEAEVVSAITNLKNDAAEVKTLRDAAAAKSKADSLAMVELAIKERRIKADEKETWLELAEGNPEATQKTLMSLNPVQSIIGQLRESSNTDSAELTYDELRKKHPEALLKLKEKDIATFNELRANSTKKWNPALAENL